MAFQNETNQRTVLAREREERAVDLRIAGKSYPQIGVEIGVSTTAAYNMVKRVLDKMIKRTSENAEQVVKIEIERINRLIAAIWGKAIGGDMAAIDRVVKLMERKAKLLGLDSSTVNVDLQKYSDEIEYI